MTTPDKTPRRWLRILFIVLLVLALLAAMVWGVKSLMGGKTGKPRKTSTVTLMPDKPPPPPPPPKEEKKPEPPKDDPKDVKMVERNEPAAPAAQNEPLKMEGAAGEGGGPFGAGSVGREYSGGSIGSVGGSAGGASYGSRLQRHIQEQLSRNRQLRESDYRITVRIWLRHDGSLERAELSGSTGSDKLDQLLTEALRQIPAMREALPENMAQPIRIRVTNRGAV